MTLQIETKFDIAECIIIIIAPIICYTVKKFKHFTLNLTCAGLVTSEMIYSMVLWRGIEADPFPPKIQILNILLYIEFFIALSLIAFKTNDNRVKFICLYLSPVLYVLFYCISLIVLGFLGIYH